MELLSRRRYEDDTKINVKNSVYEDFDLNHVKIFNCKFIFYLFLFIDSISVYIAANVRITRV
jgi:hypothetical protein